jgi:hypothetical protein
MKLPKILSDKFLEAMPAEERKKLGRGGMTSKEAQAKYVAGKEKELQRQVWNHLNRNKIYFEDDRMDKRTSGRKGRADFRCCVEGLWLSLECKSETGTLTKEQASEAARLRASGGRFVVVFTLQDAIEAIADMHAL